MTIRNLSFLYRFWHEVFGFERWHHGFWLPNDELNIENLKQAQKRYEQYFIDHIPNETKNILDVGCGTGIFTKKLLEHGYQAEGLSPDLNQKKIFEAKLNVPFHYTTFEEFSAVNQYDCLIMSEAAQYINLEKLFTNVIKVLKPQRYWLLSDPFILKNATGMFAKRGHDYEAFLQKIAKHKLHILTNQDMTNDISKTLAINKDNMDKLWIALSLGIEATKKQYPYFSRLFLWWVRNKIKKEKKHMQLLDSQQFKHTTTYRFMVLQVQDDTKKTIKNE